MRIALYTGTFFKNKDGVARTVYRLVESLIAEGHEVEVWTPEVSEETIEGIPIHVFPSLPIPLYPAYRFALPWFGFLKDLDRFDPDLIHNSTPDLMGTIITMYAKVKGIPVVACYHTDLPSYLNYYHISALKYPLLLFLRLYYNAAVGTLAPTRRIMDRLAAHGIKRVRIWSRGIDRDRFNPKFRSEALRESWGAKDKTVVLFSGRFVWYKDIQVLIDVYKMVKAGPLKDHIVFVLQGHGPEEPVLRKEMPDAVFSGYLSGKDLSEGYASGDIFLFPSRTETFGNVVQEAIASGLPAIVSDAGGCCEIVMDSGSGLVSKGGDPASFHNNLIELVEDEDLRESMRRKGLSYAEERTWKRINDDLIGYYASVVEEFNRRIERKG
jgi:glycosyltransferase involved in cell wall biosynthesis